MADPASARGASGCPTGGPSPTPSTPTGRPAGARLPRLAQLPATAALAEDRALLFRPWGFPLASVPQHVHVRHGTQDWQVPVGLSRVLAAMLPRCPAHGLAGEGHFAVFDHAAEVYAALRP